MSDLPQRFDNLRRWTRLAILLGLAAAAGFVVLGIIEATSNSGGIEGYKVVGMIVALAGVIAVALLCSIWSLVSLLIKHEAHSYRSYDVHREVQALQQESRDLLQVISDNVQLSEVARAISHRNRERNALRVAINEELIRGDWEAAYALVEQLESRHGYKNEAARLKAELDKSRELNRQHKVHDAVEQVKKLMEAHDWDRARREMDELLARSGDHPELRALPPLLEKMRGDHKRRLLKQWDETVQRNDFDRGIAILKELDQFLTPNEAAALKESARGVFRAKLHNLGVQFSLAVTDGNWQVALSIGRQIIDEFPNTRMAQEVQSRLHILTKRATDAAEPVAAT